MLNVVMLSVIVLNVMAPENVLNKNIRKNEKNSLNLKMLVANVAKLISAVIQTLCGSKLERLTTTGIPDEE